MKKIALLLVLSLSIIFAVNGCSKKEDGNDNSEATPTVTESNDDNTDNTDDIETPEFVENLVVKEEYDFNDYIKLGKYKGIEVKVEQLEVTEGDIKVQMQMDMRDNGVTLVDVADRTVELGDTINMDFVGYHDGEPFDGGAATGYEIIVGSGAFVPGFEEQLVGAELNKEIEVNIVFPENYGTFPGEPVVFKVVVNGIKLYELTDDVIKNTLEFDSEEAYKDSIIQTLEEDNVATMEALKTNDIYKAVVEDSDITLPKNLVEFYASDFRVYNTNYIIMQYGMDLETYFTLTGYPAEDFEAYVQEQANDMATRELIIKAISTAENIEVTDDEVNAEVELYAAKYGMTAEEYLEIADINVMKDNLLYNKVIDFIVAEAVEA